MTSQELHTRWLFQLESDLTSGLPGYSSLFSLSVIKVKTVLGSWRAALNQHLQHHLSSPYQTICGQTLGHTFEQVNRSIGKTNLRRKGRLRHWLLWSHSHCALYLMHTLCQARQSSWVSHPVSSSSQKQTWRGICKSLALETCATTML